MTLPTCVATVVMCIMLSIVPASAEGGCAQGPGVRRLCECSRVTAMCLFGFAAGRKLLQIPQLETDWELITFMCVLCGVAIIAVIVANRMANAEPRLPAKKAT